MSLLRTLALLSPALLLAAAAPADDAAAVNTPPKGFTALFNGKDLTGWQGLIEMPKRQKLMASDPAAYAAAVKKANAAVLPHWKVQADGTLYYDGKSNSLQTIKDYGDFELLMDWKIAPRGDSGIYLRGQPQVQVWDSERAGGATGKHKNSGSGGLYNNPEDKGQRPLVKADKPVGQWNTFHITMRGDKVTVKLNGKLVLDRQPLLNYWNRKAPLPTKGPIELQHHGDPLWFRNIYIKDLSAE